MDAPYKINTLKGASKWIRISHNYYLLLQTLWLLQCMNTIRGEKWNLDILSQPRHPNRTYTKSCTHFFLSGQTIRCPKQTTPPYHMWRSSMLVGDCIRSPTHSTTPCPPDHTSYEISTKTHAIAQIKRGECFQGRTFDVKIVHTHTHTWWDWVGTFHASTMQHKSRCGSR